MTIAIIATTVMRPPVCYVFSIIQRTRQKIIFLKCTYCVVHIEKLSFLTYSHLRIETGKCKRKVSLWRVRWAIDTAWAAAHRRIDTIQLVLVEGRSFVESHWMLISLRPMSECQEIEKGRRRYFVWLTISPSAGLLHLNALRLTR